MTDCNLGDNSMTKQLMESAESHEIEEEDTMVQKDRPHCGDKVWIYKNENGRMVRSFDSPREKNLSMEISLVTNREHHGDNNASEEQEDEVSIAEIENACKKLREIKGVEPRKRNANVRRRQMSELNALANTMGFDFGVLADGGEQTLTEGQTLAQALQESFGSHATADPNHAVTTLSSLGSILGIPVAVSVEERSGDSETTNEREPRRVLAEGENAAARMIESLFAHLTDGAGLSNDAESGTTDENSVRSTGASQRENRFVIHQQPAALPDEGALAERIASLVELGFPEGAAHAALRITGGDPDAAAAILLEQQESE